MELSTDPFSAYKLSMSWVLKCIKRVLKAEKIWPFLIGLVREVRYNKMSLLQELGNLTGPLALPWK